MVTINILGLHISTSTEIFAAVVAGAGVLVTVLIILCCYCLCCRGKDREKRKRTTNSLPAQNPAQNPLRADRGNNQHGEPVQQRQQQNINPPRVAEQRMNPNPFPPPAALPMQKPPTLLPSLSSTESSGSNKLPPPQQSKRSPTPEYPSAYPHYGKSNASGSEISSIAPASPALSHGSSQTMFSYNDLAMATNGFSKANFLGEGGFGLVHKGVLPNRKAIAVKSLRANSGQGEREFEAEVEIINRVHHKHLVSLVGYCSTGSHRLLVYEFVPNRTLEFHLHGEGQPTMDWATRMRVAVGAAKGLAYLHEDCQPRIIHRDVKAANILLDNKFQAKVADFGLAKITPEEDTHISTRIMGTLGYLAPEYAASGRLTDKSDVFSFGVILLELITGRRPLDRTRKEYDLVEWARPLLTTAIEDENLNILVDPRLQFSYKHSEMSRIVACAGACVRKSARLRPPMSQVVRALEGNLSINDLNEGITPGRSFIKRYHDTASENSGSHYREGSTGYSEDLYKADSAGFDSRNMAPSTREHGTSEYGATTSEYGLYASSSSSEDEDQTSQELDSKAVQRNRRRFKQHS